MPKNSSDKMIRIHVTFGETKRIVVFQKGGEVKKLRPLFLHAFSDVLSDDIAPEHVNLQEYRERFKDFVELSLDSTLDGDIKIRAITSKSLKQGGSWRSDVHHIPWYSVSMALPHEFKPHPIQPHVDYQFWNPVCNGLIQMDLSRVEGNGSFGNNPNTVVRAEDFGHDLFYLYFKDGESKMYITSQGEGETIKALAPPTDHSRFMPEPYWSYTLFKSVAPGNDLYLACNQDKTATLVRTPNVQYPDPRTLFIVTQG